MSVLLAQLHYYRYLIVAVSAIVVSAGFILSAPNLDANPAKLFPRFIAEQYINSVTLYFFNVFVFSLAPILFTLIAHNTNLVQRLVYLLGSLLIALSAFFAIFLHKTLIVLHPSGFYCLLATILMTSLGQAAYDHRLNQNWDNYILSYYFVTPTVIVFAYKLIPSKLHDLVPHKAAFVVLALLNFGVTVYFGAASVKDFVHSPIEFMKQTQATKLTACLFFDYLAAAIGCAFYTKSHSLWLSLVTLLFPSVGLPVYFALEAKTYIELK